VGGILSLPLTSMWNVAVKKSKIYSTRQYDSTLAFSSHDYNKNLTEPEELKLRLLQKFLMAFVIARPSTLLKLKGRRRYRVLFDLLPSDVDEVNDHMLNYEAAVRSDRAEFQRQQIEGLNGDDERSPLLHAVRAQMWSLHRLLGVKSNKKDENSRDAVHDKTTHSDDDNRPAGAVNSHTAFINNTMNRLVGAGPLEVGATRDEWLEKLEDDREAVFDSNRVKRFLLLYDWIRQTYPDEKIVVFSLYRQFLDILSAALKWEHDIEALRFDGTVGSISRETVRRIFDSAHPRIPLLLTGGAGGVGLNIARASVIVQTEIWWNRNFEYQAYGRCYRQGQERLVKVFRLEARNSRIDSVIRSSQNKKTAVNERLMLPILRKPEDPPEIPKILPALKLDMMEFEETKQMKTKKDGA
jgi:SNF2 family DNA or RNA helicase